MSSELKPCEAIEILEDIYPSKKQIVTGEYPEVAEALDMAIAALRRDQATNKPLTLEQLQEMGGSPVWWWNKSHAPVCTICIVRFGEVSFADFDYSHEDSTGIVRYKQWIKWGFKPYRRKPEGSENG